MVFSTALWCFWLYRNNIFHGNHLVFSDNYPLSLLPRKIIKRFVETIHSISRKTGRISQLVSHVVKWSTPLDWWYMLNTDGVAKGSPGLVGASGIIRDSLGRWVKRFHRGLGLTFSIVAKLWGLLKGLKLAHQLNISHLIIEIEMDAQIIVNLLNMSCSNSLLVKPLLFECNRFLETILQSQIRHVFIEANYSVDFLTDLGAQIQPLLTLLCSPPEGLVPFLNYDMSFAVSTRYSTVELLNG